MDCRTTLVSGLMRATLSKSILKGSHFFAQSQPIMFPIFHNPGVTQRTSGAAKYFFLAAHDELKATSRCVIQALIFS
jgi:hypothetical protein